MNKTLLPLLLICFLPANLVAFNLSEPVSFLGAEISDLFSADQEPLEIYPDRGVEPDEDNVVFYYRGGFYLFLYKNRVWQVRFDRTSEELPLDLEIGEGRSTLLARLMEDEMIPLSTDDDSVTYQLRKSPWPVRMTLYFSEDKLDDIYFYRADF